jgi:hypothetical protein
MTIDSSGPEAPPPVSPAAKPNGLATYFGVLFSPGESFATLARTPMWGWAAIIGMLLVVAATIISMPEILKIGQIAQAQAISQMSADAQARAHQNLASFAGVIRVSIIVGSFIGPWIGWLIAAVVFLIGALASKADAKFGRAWTLAVNSFVVFGLGQLVNSVILAMRGPDSISAPADAYAIPSLAMFAHDSPKLAAGLYAFNPFNLWFYAVAAIGLQIVMRMKPPAAWITVLIYALIGAGIASGFAK